MNKDKEEMGDRKSGITRGCEYLWLLPTNLNSNFSVALVEKTLDQLSQYYLSSGCYEFLSQASFTIHSTQFGWISGGPTDKKGKKEHIDESLSIYNKLNDFFTLLNQNASTTNMPVLFVFMKFKPSFWGCRHIVQVLCPWTFALLLRCLTK